MQTNREHYQYSAMDTGIWPEIRFKILQLFCKHLLNKFFRRPEALEERNCIRYARE